jgi:hypothetical protein
MNISLPEFHKQLRAHFKLNENAGKYLDSQLTMLTRSPKLGIIKLDDLLHERHGEYEGEGLSMKECIDKHYSPAASAFVKSLI